MTSPPLSLFSAILILAVLYSGPAFSDLSKESETRAYLQYRKTQMGTIKKHFHSISPIIKFNLPVKGHLVVHARAIYGILQSFASLYPEGSGKSVKNKYWTKAKPTVWTDPELFSAYLLSLQDLSLLLIDAAERDDMSEVEVIRKHMNTICQNCHHHFKNSQSDIVYENE